MVLGEKIEFPSLLLKELISHFVIFNRSKGFEVGDFDFVYRGHFNDLLEKKRIEAFRIPPDNTPLAIVGIKITEVSKTLREEHHRYIERYRAIHKHCQNVLDRAIKLSSLDPKVIKKICAFSSYMLETKASQKLILQHIFMVGLHAKFLKRKEKTNLPLTNESENVKKSQELPRKYINAIQNDYVQQILSRIKFSKDKPELIVTNGNKIDHYFRKLRSAYLSKHYAPVIKMLGNDNNQWIYLTVTAKGRFHANSINWNGSTPQVVAKMFQEGWTRVRAILKDREIDISGLWTLEFHQDSCPHRNFLLVVEKKKIPTVIRVFKTVFNNEVRVTYVDTGVKNKEELDPYKKFTYIYKYAFPYVNDENKKERLIDRAIASLFGLKIHGGFGKYR